MECYGSSGEEYITLIFLSEDPSGLCGQLYSAQLVGGRGGRAESLGPIVPDNAPKASQRIGLCQVFKASVSVFKDVPMGSDSNPDTCPEMQDF